MGRKYFPPFDEGLRSTKEHRLGRMAYLKGEPEDACTFLGDGRIAWFSGYFDERTSERVGHILEKYGLSWP